MKNPCRRSSEYSYSPRTLSVYHRTHDRRCWYKCSRARDIDHCCKTMKFGYCRWKRSGIQYHEYRSHTRYICFYRSIAILGRFIGRYYCIPLGSNYALVIGSFLDSELSWQKRMTHTHQLLRPICRIFDFTGNAIISIFQNPPLEGVGDYFIHFRHHILLQYPISSRVEFYSSVLLLSQYLYNFHCIPMRIT